MAAAPQSSFPAAALDWLVPTGAARVLALGRTCAPLMADLAARGHRLTANDHDATGVRKLLERAPRALPTVSDAARLPFVPCAFDVVVVNQSFHTIDAAKALPELARILAPGGHLALAYTIRDDSVPWVKRLVRLMQSIDPEAMTGSYGDDSLHQLDEHPLFPQVERKNVRIWMPISREGLLAMVRGRFPDLDDETRSGLLEQVAALYDSSARRPEPLLLPYQVACWRAYVDHGPLNAAKLARPDEGLTIRL